MPDEAMQVKPAARWAHCAVWDGGDRLVIFGGQTNSHHLGDLHFFSLKEQRWHQPVCFGAPPSPRQGARAALLAANLMLVFGGCSENVRQPPSLPVVQGISGPSIPFKFPGDRQIFNAFFFFFFNFPGDHRTSTASFKESRGPTVTTAFPSVPGTSRPLMPYKCAVVEALLCM